jgi:AmiR/NasT family two-component response regulator
MGEWVVASAAGGAFIGQAKGRLMERFDIDAAEAFERLKQMSQDRNTPIAQVAQRVAGGDSSLFK